MLKLDLQTFALKRPTAPGATTAPDQGSAPVATQATPQPPVQQQPAAPVAQQQPAAPVAQQQPAAPAVQNQGNSPAVQNGAKAAMMDFHNQGGDVVLEGFEEWNGGNYVTVDGSDFYIKATETRVRDLTVVVSYARQYYKWYDRDSKQWHEAPNKVDNRYALAAELKWYDWIEGEDEPKEFTMSISTTSTLQFREYVQKLRDSGVRINGIWTRMTIERLERIDPDTKEKQRYSRVKFENAGPVVYDQQQA